MNILPFASPFWLLCLLIIPIIIYLYIKNKFKRKSFIRFSNLSIIKASGGNVSRLKKHIIFSLHILAIIVLIFAMARPQYSLKTYVDVEGVDIVLLLDLSRSMKFIDGTHPDFEHITRGNRLYYYDKYGTIPNRLQIAKKVIKDFIRKRPNDQLGLVVFAEFPLSLCPLTLDHNILIEYLEDVSLERIGALGDTAIGDGIGIAINSLRTSKAKSKLVILLTDGNNNTGEKGPIEVARIAKRTKTKIYTIGIGDIKDVYEPDENAGKGFYVLRPVNHGERLDTSILNKNIRDNRCKKLCC